MCRAATAAAVAQIDRDDERTRECGNDDDDCDERCWQSRSPVRTRAANAIERDGHNDAEDEQQ